MLRFYILYMCALLTRSRILSEGSGSRAQRGAAVVEASFVIPLLLFTLLGALELGRGMQQHLKMTRIAYEGLRFAATVPGIQATDSATTGYFWSDCIREQEGLTCPIELNRIRARINDLIIRNGLGGASPGVGLRVLADQGRPTNIELLIQTTFRPQLTKYVTPVSRLSVEVTGPYLSNQGQ